MGNVRVQVVYDYKHEGNDADGLQGTVWVRIYAGRSRRSYVSTGVRVLPSQWSDEFGVIGRPDAAVLNERIAEQVRATRERVAEELADGGVELRASDTKVARSTTDWLDWLADRVNNDKRVARNTHQHHLALVRALEDWGKMRTFADVRPDVIKSFIAWLYEKTVRRCVDGVVADVPISDAGVYGYTKYLRKFIREAQEDGKVSQRALVGVDFRKGTPSVRVALTDDEIERWRAVELTKPYLIEARDRFIVQMATGLSFCDLLETDFSRVQEIDGLITLSGTRAKTGKAYFLVILPMARDILARWGGRVPRISNVNYNLYLKEIARIAGIDKVVTSHIGRHTYACHILRHGVRMEAVQRTLGHSRIQTTQIYAQLVDRDVMDAFGAFARQ